MKLTRPEKELLLEALEELVISPFDKNEIAKELDRKSLIQKIRQIEPIDVKY